MTGPILILDDSELILSMLQMVCAQGGHGVVTASDFEQARAIVSRETPRLVLTDLNLPDLPAADPVTALRALPQLASTPIVLISGRPQAELDAEAERLGAQGALSKDLGMPGIAAALPGLLDRLSPG